MIAVLGCLHSSAVLLDRAKESQHESQRAKEPLVVRAVRHVVMSLVVCSTVRRVSRCRAVQVRACGVDCGIATLIAKRLLRLGLGEFQGEIQYCTVICKQ